MKLINNRYRVVNIINDKKEYREYLCEDLWNEEQMIQINIVKENKIPRPIINYLKEESINLSSFKTDGILRNTSFGLISDIDGASLSRQTIFYSKEYIKNPINIFDYTDKLSLKEILDIFVDLSATIYYLHLKGYYYGYLNFNKLYFIQGKEGIRPKLKDYFSLIIESNPPGNDRKFFKPSDFTSRHQEADIHSLINILIGLIGGKEPTANYNLNSLEWILQDKSFKKFSPREQEKIKGLTRLINSFYNRKYPDIKYLYQLIELINKEIGTAYTLINKSQLQVLDQYPKLVGREEILASIFTALKSMKESSKGKKIFLLEGEFGSGKTRFLQELKFLLGFENCNIYSSLSLKTLNEKEIWDKIIRKIILSNDKKSYDKYNHYLQETLSDLAVNSLLDLKLKDMDISARVANRIAHMIGESSDKKPSILIFDDIHYGDTLTMATLQYLIHDIVADKNVMVILSYNKLAIKDSVGLSKFIESSKDLDGSLNLTLDNLDLDNTGEMIRAILRMPHIPQKLTPVVYRKSHGNPFFIMEIIKGLYERQLIFIKEDTGFWHIKVDQDDGGYENLNMPESLEQIFLYRLEDLDETTIHLLDSMALFYQAFNAIDYARIFKLDLKDLEACLEQLVDRGILSQVYSDHGILYEFVNRILKDFIYSRLSKDFRRKNHGLLADYLEDKLDKAEGGVLDELLYQLYQADSREKLSKYAIISAREKLKIKNHRAAINQLEKALYYMKYNSDDDLCEIMLEIALRYYKLEDIEKLEEYLSKAEKLGVKDTDKLINIYLLRVEYKRYVLDNETIYDQLDKASQLIDRTNDFELKLRYKFFTGICKIADRDYDGGLEILYQVVEEAGNQYIQIKGEAYRYLGRAYSRKYGLDKDDKLLDKTIAYLDKAISLFEETGDKKGLAYTLFLLGNIQYRHYKDYDQAFEYHLRSYKIGKEHNYLSIELIGLNNLGNNMLERYEFKRYREYLKKALDRALETNFTSRLPLMYYHLTYGSYYLADYKELESYYQLSLENPFYRDDGYKNTIFLNVLRLSAYGAYEEAYKAILDLIDIPSNRHPEYESYKKIRKYLIELKLDLIDGERDYFDEIFNRTSALTNKQYNILNIYETVIELFKNGRVQEAEKLFHAMVGDFKQSYPHEIKARYYYTRAVISPDEDKLELLDLAEKYAGKQSIKLLLIRIAIERGHYYYGKNDYISLSFYMDALDKIHFLGSTIPHDYRLYFINNFDYQNIFTNMGKIKDRLFKNGDKKEEDFLQEKSLDKLKYLLRDNSINIINNRDFENAIKNIYGKHYNDNIFTGGLVAKTIKSDYQASLELMLEYFANIVLAKNAAIIIEEEGEYLPIASLEKGFSLSKYTSILDKAKNKRKSAILLDSRDLGTDFPLSYILIPVLDPISSSKILAYIYLETSSIVNYFNQESIDKIQGMEGLLLILLENYRLRRLSMVDKLTGALSRRALEDKINDCILLANKRKEKLSIIMLDLDKFKSINDRFGHLTGDIVLREVVRIVLDSLEDNCFLGRYGGEEFVIILPDIDKTKAFSLAEEIRLKILNEKMLGDRAIISVSMGVSTYPSDGDNLKDLIDRADQALYQAKETGRNKTVSWDRGTGLSPGLKEGGKLNQNIYDARNTLAIVELVQLMNEDIGGEDKIYSYLGRIIDSLEVEHGYIFLMEDGKIKESFGRSRNNDKWLKEAYYNKDIVEEVIESREGRFLIDWTDVKEKDLVMGLPLWNSIIAFPVIRKNQIKALIYLVSPLKLKEFDQNDYDMVEIFSNILNIW